MKPPIIMLTLLLLCCCTTVPDGGRSAGNRAPIAVPAGIAVPAIAAAF